MAEKTSRRSRDEVFWSNIDRKSTGEDSDMDAYIPGVSDPGNRRPSRIKGRKTREVKAKIPVKQPLVEELLDSSVENREPEIIVKKKKPKPGNQSYQHSNQHQQQNRRHDNTTILSTSLESLRERSIRQLREITLKDLRAEDKQRVANLVRELARIGEEKEKAVSELHGERQQYENQLLTLVQQQEKILREREDVQEKLFQCQTLLTQYQAQILNKQDRLSSEKDDHTSHRKSRATSSRPDTDKGLAHLEDDDADSVTNLLLSNKDPADSVKRPYSSMIDKEIARERSLSRGSHGSARSRSVSPLDGRPRFTYPQKLDGIGPLPEPVASSTHKSLEINAQMSHNQDLESPRSSIRGSSVRAQSPGDEKHQRKIAFREERETEDLVKKYTPNMKGKELFNDPDYAGYYKKLSPAGRKRELLKQRQALLDEQDRLKQVLENQEKQLKVRQYEYQKREELQKQRMEFYKEGGKFPALKLDFDAGGVPGMGSEDDESSERERFNEEVGKEATDRIRDMEKIEIRSRSPRDEVRIDDDVRITSRVSAGTSPISSPRAHRVSVTMSPLQGHVEVNEVGRPKPRVVDVGTSISYRSPLQDTSNTLQGNLPLHSNRQRHSQGTKQGHSQTPRSEQQASPRTPGDKTLNVLDIVNSMEESPRGSRGDIDVENRPLTFTPNKYLVHQTGNQRSPYRPAPSSSQSGTSLRKPQADPEESVEENRILEDIFFL